MGTTANVTSGPSNLWIAPYVAGGPFPTLTGSATDFAAFTLPGFTSDGIEWDYSPSWKDFMVDERLEPIKKKITAHKLVVSCKMAETTLQNLTYAIAAATFNGSDTVTIGSPDDAPEFTLGWAGPCPGAPQGTRQVLIYRCVSFAATKAHYQRKDMALYTVQFEALAEDSQPIAASLATYKDFPSIPFVLS
jgi:hypothetical protein